MKKPLPKIIQIVPAPGWKAISTNKTVEPVACFGLTEDGEVIAIYPIGVSPLMRSDDDNEFEGVKKTK